MIASLANLLIFYPNSIESIIFFYHQIIFLLPRTAGLDTIKDKLEKVEEMGASGTVVGSLLGATGTSTTVTGGGGGAKGGKRTRRWVAEVHNTDIMTYIYLLMNL